MITDFRINDKGELEGKVEISQWDEMYTKDEVVAMLEELKDEASNIIPTIYNCASFSEGIRAYDKLIQQKINALNGKMR